MYEDLELGMFKEDQLADTAQDQIQSELNDQENKFDRDRYIREYIFGRDMLYIIDKWEKETFLKSSESSEPSVGESSDEYQNSKSLSNSRTRKIRDKHSRNQFPFKFEKLDKNNYRKFDPLEMFKQSFKSRPKMTEQEPTPLAKKHIPKDLFSILPQYSMILPEVFSKMELDTLFFVVRFDPNEWHKLYASTELKKRGWKMMEERTIWVQQENNLKFDTKSKSWAVKCT